MKVCEEFMKDTLYIKELLRLGVTIAVTTS